MPQPIYRRIEFTKMSGAGNDFVVVDNRDGVIHDPTRFAVVLCDRRRGIGADGLLLLERSAAADFGMKYYNADGTYGGMCGNGGRCISRFAYHKGIVTSPEVKFEALDYVYAASIGTTEVELRMKPPVRLSLRKEIELSVGRLLVHFVDTGSPHCVIFLDENKTLGSLFALRVTSIGSEIRNNKEFLPEGVNANFVEIESSTKIAIRTYERGVEAETLACGTGSVASAIVAAEVKKVLSPVSVGVQSGEFLKVNFKNAAKGSYSDVSLSGSAHITFEGIVRYDFLKHSIIDVEA